MSTPNGWGSFLASKMANKWSCSHCLGNVDALKYPKLCPSCNTPRDDDQPAAPATETPRRGKRRSARGTPAADSAKRAAAPVPSFGGGFGNVTMPSFGGGGGAVPSFGGATPSFGVPTFGGVPSFQGTSFGFSAGMETDNATESSFFSNPDSVDSTGAETKELMKRFKADQRMLKGRIAGRNKVLSFGYNLFGQAGFGLDEDGEPEPQSSATPIPVQGLEGLKIESIAPGVNHSAAILDEGILVTWGSCDDGVLGRDTYDAPYLLAGPVDFGNQTVEVTQVRCGAHHTIALDSLGRVWTWGRYNDFDNSANIGYNKDHRSMAKPNMLRGFNDRPVISIAAGDNFDLALTDRGDVFQWGQEYRSRDIHPEVRSAATGPLPPNSDDMRFVHRALEPHLAPRALGYDRRMGPAVAVFASHITRFVVTAGGHVFSWGSNDSGQAGMLAKKGSKFGVPHDIQFFHNPTYISSLEGVHVVKIVGGAQHSVALDKDGRVFSWGYNGWGQLGKGEMRHHYPPHEVFSGQRSRVIDIGAGDEHTMFLKANGDVLICGGNDDETLRLGIEGTQYINTPTSISQFPGAINLGVKNVKSVACGSSTNFILLKK